MKAEPGQRAVVDHTLWFDNDRNLVGAPSTNHVEADPLLAAWTADGDCSNDDWTLLPGSPARDAGNPAWPDLDGTPNDIGVTGGPLAAP